MRWLKRIAKSLLIGSAMGIGVALFTNLFFTNLINRLEDQTYYMRYHWEFDDQSSGKHQKVQEEDNGINIIDIDERSLHKLGKYQNWDRSFHAQMIRALEKHFPAALLFDIMFFDPDDKNYVSRIDRLIDTCKSRSAAFSVPDNVYKPLVSAIDYDEQFISATRDAGNVFHALMMADKWDYSEFAQSQIANMVTMAWHDSLHPSSALMLTPEKRRRVLDVKPVIDGTFPRLARAARDIGVVNIPPNSDGVIREIPLLTAFGNNPPVYLPISIRAVATLFGTPNNEINFEPGRYLDIGRPFKAFKDSMDGLRFSYPNVTAQQVKAIIDKSAEIMSCAPDKSVEVSAQLKIGRDSSGGRFIDMYCGVFPWPVAKVLMTADIAKILSLAKNATLELAPSVAIKRSSDVDWVLTAPEGDGEWDMAKLDLETISKVTQADCDALKPGQTKLLFYGFAVKNKEGKLSSSLPIMNASVLADLCRTKWDAIASMPAGMRMDFGQIVRIPLTKDNRHVVTYFGPKAKTFHYYSFYDIMKDRVQGALEGKIFLVGSTVAGLFDVVSTPIDSKYPGVEIHASLINSFLTNTFVTRLSKWQDFFILLFVAIVIGFMSYFMKPLYGSILSIVAVFAYFVIAMTMFGGNHVWIEIARPILVIVITFTAVMAYRYITEEKDRKFLQSTFKQYLSPDLIDMMYSSKQQPKLGGDEGIRTAYFTDIQGFSTFSEKLGSPTRLVELLNEYLTEMTNTLLARFGTLDKYEGDAIIAFFGAPMPMEDHAKQACLTALDMQVKLGELRKKWVSEGDKWPTIVHEMRMRIGVNSGPIVTGNMGSKTRMNYTMMGDTVNLAARLESAAKQYGVFIMISHFTYDMVKNDFEVRQLDKITVVGKSEPIVVYELISEKGKWSPEVAKMVDLYSQGLASFYKQEWDKAIEILTESDKLEPYRHFAKTTPSKKVIGYCQQFKAAPPGPDWDGVIRLTSK
jgi:class 3 adenylate cyclase/CHASE2 domain-containing sensor protein